MSTAKVQEIRRPKLKYKLKELQILFLNIHHQKLKNKVLNVLPL
jgi:hypothetical protein